MNLIKHQIVDKIILQSDLYINEVITYESYVYKRVFVELRIVQIIDQHRTFLKIIEAVSNITSKYTHYETTEARVYR